MQAQALGQASVIDAADATMTRAIRGAESPTSGASGALMRAITLGGGILLSLLFHGSVLATNQIVGYGLLDYPQTANSFAWGGAIGLGAVAALFAARVVGNFGWSNIVATVASFASAFIAYEGTLYLASFGLGGSDAFSFDIVSRILVINALAFAAILALYAVAGLLKTGREKAVAVRA